MVQKRLRLRDDEHVEWTIFRKLTKHDSGITNETIKQRAWRSLDEKVETLRRMHRAGNLIGLPANQLLTCGRAQPGHYLMWVDVDVIDREGVCEWAQTVFPEGSYIITPSSTFKSHVYVRTDRPLLERWQHGLRVHLRDSMPEHLQGFLDRIYGPQSQRAVFLPNVSLVEAIMPQELCAGLKETYRLPVDTIEDPSFRRAQERRRGAEAQRRRGK